MKSLKVTTLYHHELHGSSPRNTLACIHVSAQRYLKYSLALHVVGMLYSILTKPTKSMALLYSSAQHPHWLIHKKSPCHTNKSTCIMSLHKPAMVHVSNSMSITQASHFVQLSRSIAASGHPHPSLQFGIVKSVTKPYHYHMSLFHHGSPTKGSTKTLCWPRP